jgi:hypothetical protein
MTPNERAKFRALKAELDGERQLADHLAEALTYGGVGNAMQALLHHEIARRGKHHKTQPVKYRKATRDLGSGQHVEWKGFNCEPFRRIEFEGENLWIQPPTDSQEDSE